MQKHISSNWKHSLELLCGADLQLSEIRMLGLLCIILLFSDKCIYISETRILEINPGGIFREILSNYIYGSKNMLDYFILIGCIDWPKHRHSPFQMYKKCTLQRV